MRIKRTIASKHRYLGWAAILLAPVVLGAKGCDVAVVGSECGGLAGIDCGEGQYCDFELDAACGAADQTGSCREIPEICADIFAPVCGCDDTTYSNACEANGAGVSVASEGECAPDDGNACGGIQGLACADGNFCAFAPDAFCGAADQTGTCQPTPETCPADFDPVCGCNDVTYSNACVANAAGVSVASEGECAPSGGNACGGIQGLACAEGEYCDFPLDALCGAADQTGTCLPIPQVCADIFDPVCGCDDQTYSNACEANGAGVSVASEGACETSGGNACGGIQGLACAENEFCEFAPDAFCGAADQTGTCQPIPQACDLIFDPVCGCDDQTYGNACEASLNGVSVASEGECAPNDGNACGGIQGLACAENEFCSFAPDAICGAADQTGTCQPIPEACPQQFDPVCGCNDVTYGNACEANAAGVSVASEGECP